MITAPHLTVIGTLTLATRTLALITPTTTSGHGIDPMHMHPSTHQRTHPLSPSRRAALPAPLTTGMFERAAAFDQNLNGWDTGSVTTMASALPAASNECGRPL